MSQRLSLAIFQDAFHERQIEPTNPPRQSVFAKNREDFPPAVNIPIEVRDGGDFHDGAKADRPSQRVD
jgi:hypothetical protein